MNTNYNFFIKVDMDSYVGKWVAISDNKIIASGKDVRKVIDTAKSINPRKRPFITKVPEKTAMIF